MAMANAMNPGCCGCSTPTDGGTIPISNCLCSVMPREFFFQYKWNDPALGNPSAWHEPLNSQGQVVRYSASTPAIYLAGEINQAGTNDIQAGQLGPGWYSDIAVAQDNDVYGNPSNPPSYYRYFYYLRCTTTSIQFSYFWRGVNSPQGKFYRNSNGAMGSFSIRSGNACSPFCFSVPNTTFSPEGYAYRPGELAPNYEIRAGCVTLPSTGGTDGEAAMAIGGGADAFNDGDTEYRIALESALQYDFRRLAMGAELCPMGSGPCGCGSEARLCGHPDRPLEVWRHDCIQCVSLDSWERVPG